MMNGARQPGVAGRRRCHHPDRRKSGFGSGVPAFGIRVMVLERRFTREAYEKAPVSESDHCFIRITA